ncbi:MAG: Arc family DNA-binding protein [Anaerolineales bacterium]|nr:Arc family DNA-binding protein [Anaerolineales bacterium]
MATITVKNIPDDLYTLLKQSARANHRSINSEIIFCIERAVRSQRVEPGEVLEEARTLREKTTAYRITDEDFRNAKTEGRL